MEPKQRIDWKLAGKYLQNEASTSECTAFEAWLAESPQNDLFFQEVKKVWETTGLVRDKDFLDREWNHFQQLRQRESRTQPTPFYKRFPAWTKVAAAILVLAVMSWAIWPSHSEKSPAWTHVKTGAGERAEVSLSDGSTVFLNASSELRYPQNFGNQTRHLQLDGEAYFEVAHNPDKPFRIQSENSITKVLGTSFNVFTSSDSVVVSVHSGKVALFPVKDSTKAVELVKGESGVWHTASRLAQKRSFQDPNYRSWQTRTLTFKRTPLAIACKTLEHYYGIKFQLSPTLEKCNWTVNLSDPSLTEVLEMLSLTFALTYQQLESEVQLSGDGC